MGRSSESIVLDTHALDTHVLIWLLEREDSLGPTARLVADAALKDNSRLVSVMSFWEVAMLSRRDRLALTQPPLTWRRNTLNLGLIEISVSRDIGILSADLDNFHRDPADRIISATAVAQGTALITADSRILEWPGTLHRRDARTWLPEASILFSADRPVPSNRCQQNYKQNRPQHDEGGPLRGFDT